jgi:hypothetical protein
LVHLNFIWEERQFVLEDSMDCRFTHLELT